MNKSALPKLILGFIALACLFVQGARLETVGAPSALEEGGDFTLSDAEGKRFQLKELRGRAVLLYFGYTSCAEACPTMLVKVSAAFKRLGPLADKTSVVLVTLDPERDTPGKLKKYLAYFKVNGIGLTGQREEIDKVVKQYGAKYEVVKSDSALGYHIDHTTDLYLIDRDGKLRHRFKHDDPSDIIAEGVKQLFD